MNPDNYQECCSKFIVLNSMEKCKGFKADETGVCIYLAKDRCCNARVQRLQPNKSDRRETGPRERMKNNELCKVSKM